MQTCSIFTVAQVNSADGDDNISNNSDDNNDTFQLEAKNRDNNCQQKAVIKGKILSFLPDNNNQYNIGN